ncbi:Glutathione S-transferase S1 [Modicella reniformis]|uniref:Glutathione S-transferase S1 n=1 Tax=Modicella reniformis TaxID=1440133 RepID=A0A9P6SSV8_9FUNG|nr:Glutathione S-transferase S1 [Modicella reniformis]
MTNQVHSFFNPAQTADFNELATKTDSHFEVKYFDFHGLGAVARTILAAANAKFTNSFPTDFPSEKALTPFGLIPLLKETSADGKITIQIAESDAIERYLGKKFGFLGQNAFEETLINTFISNSAGMASQVFIRYFSLKDEAQKAEAKAKLIEGPLKDWAKHHEQHLSANGSNGHYVGDKTSLADFKVAFLISIVQGIAGDEVISESKTPAIMKVKATVDAIPGVAKWQESAEYKAISDKTFNALGFR